MTYQPETNVLPISGKYRPMYRLYPHERWRLIRKDKKPVECDTAYQAKKIAEEMVDAIVNPAHLIDDEPQPLGDIEEWRRLRTASVAAEKQRVFGAAGPTRLFIKGREIKVEKRRARA
jgi:hypothetical protein